jgi:hypothetical protein
MSRLHQVRPVVSELNVFLDKILWWSLNSIDSELQQDSALHLLASILNKRVDADSEFSDSSKELVS